MSLSLPLFFLIGCAQDASLETRAAYDTGALDADASACDVGADAAPYAAAEVLFARGVAGSPLGDGVRVVEDAEAWEAVRGAVDWGGAAPPEAVDFDVVRLVVVSASVASTCSMGVSGVDVYEGPTPHVVALFEDRTGACEVACEAEGAAVAVVAVPRDAGVPTACGARIDTCEGM